MALPKIQHPTFQVVVPSTKQTITMRPFLVKEEKILLIAQTSDNPTDIVLALKQVINNCIVGESDFKVDEMTTFDLEFLFIRLRARSINNMIELTYKDNEDQKSYTLKCNLDEVNLTETPTHTNIIPVQNLFEIVMKYPRVDMMDKVQKAQNETEVFFDVLRFCIDAIKEHSTGTTYSLQAYSKEEAEEFISGLDVATFTEIQKFFATMPRLHHELKYTNSLQHERTVVLDNLNDFFTLG